MQQQPPTRRRSALAGGAALVAVVSYLLATVVGGSIVPGYSHLSEAISELTGSHGPHRLPIGAGYAVYNVALVAMVVGLWRRSAPSRAVRAAYLLLVVAATAGVLMIGPYPQDTTGTPATAAGAVHLALAGLASLTVFVAAVLLGIGWRGDPRWRALARPSLAVAAALLVTAPIGFAIVGPGSPWFGLVERVVIGIILLWLTLIAGHALRRDEQAVPTATRELVRS